MIPCLSYQTVAMKYHFPLKGTRVLRELANLTLRAGNAREEPGASDHPRKQGRPQCDQEVRQEVPRTPSSGRRWSTLHINKIHTVAFTYVTRDCYELRPHPAERRCHPWKLLRHHVIVMRSTTWKESDIDPASLDEPLVRTTN